MERDEILGWLKELDESRLEALWAQADAVREARVGPEVHFRGLIEISNHCVRHCQYCGISATAAGIRRYRMTEEEILACAEEAKAYSYGTVVVQAGEDPGLTQAFIAQLVGRIKERTGLAVTLSLGEREDDELRSWKAAGADRYLLRFESSDPELYRRIHPSRPGGSTALGGYRGRGLEAGHLLSKSCDPGAAGRMMGETGDRP
ncbi:biotin synthase BioB [Holophaga foetida]|uniref:biotin synthase BioB n=1 Tax=Holophaga foetida TaxID=35839 RepID=UPI0002474CEB|nr:radical SAM protein [Holophaga foetida]